jgi:Mrp family chromosome partitioning ATPase
MAPNRSPKHAEITDQIQQEKQRKRGPIKFQIQLNDEQKIAKEKIVNNAITILSGKAGSGKCLDYDYEVNVQVDDDFYDFLVENEYL